MDGAASCGGLAVCEICELAIFEHDTESRTFPRMNV